MDSPTKNCRSLNRPNILHVAVDVLLKAVNFVCPAVVLQVGDNLLHVVLQVDSVVLLRAESRLGKTVVEDDVNTTDGARISASIAILALSGGVGAVELDVALCSCLVLAVHLVNAVVHQLHGVGIREQLIS